MTYISPQRVSQKTRDQIDERIKHYREIPSFEYDEEQVHESKLRRLYAQMRVLHDIISKEWDCPPDLKAALFAKTKPLCLLRVSDDFFKCFVGSTSFAGKHLYNINYHWVLHILSLPEERLKHMAEARRRHCLARVKGKPYSLFWNNGCCFVLRPGVLQDFLYLPVSAHVFHPGYFPRHTATPAQMYQASRTLRSNERLYCTPLYAALVDSLCYLLRVARFDEDPFSDFSPPVFHRPAFAIMVDASPAHGRSLFATITKKVAASTPPRTPVVVRGSTLADCASVVRPSFPCGEHYAFNYVNQKGGPWARLGLDTANLLATTEGRFGGGERVHAGSPLFFANCTHDGNSYVYTVELEDSERPIVERIPSVYKMPVLTAARDLYVADFVEGERVARAAGYGAIPGVYRLALEYTYSTSHVVRGAQKNYVKCQCLTHCFGRESDWHFFVDPGVKAPPREGFDLERVRTLGLPEQYEAGVERWLAFAESAEGVV